MAAGSSRPAGWHRRTASSDGQLFPAGGREEALNLINARYGAEPGVKAYSHVSDRFSPFATQTIPATAHEAPYILDGLLMNETGRRVREQYTPTPAASPTMSSPRARRHDHATDTATSTDTNPRAGDPCSAAPPTPPALTGFELERYGGD